MATSSLPSVYLYIVYKTICTLKIIVGSEQRTGNGTYLGGGGEGDEGEEEDEKTFYVPSILTSDWCTTW